MYLYFCENQQVYLYYVAVAENHFLWNGTRAGESNPRFSTVIASTLKYDSPPPPFAKEKRIPAISFYGYNSSSSNRPDFAGHGQ